MNVKKNHAELRKKISQLFVWGFEGTEITPELKILLKKYPPAGLILFKRNIEDLYQMKGLIQELQSLSRIPLLIGIDEEGGRVRRLPQPFTQLPSAAFFGRLLEEQKDKRLIFDIGRYLAHELLSLGINTDFAPVLDVNSNPKNPIIGDRAFSKNPKLAAEAAVAFYLGMKKAGVIACGKHFPGHGDTKTDSHLALPHVNRTEASLRKIELFPFYRAIQKGIPMLMTAHVVYRAWDSKNPATLSSKILRGLLREKMGFKGVIISDDLEMKAVRYPVLESSLLSLQAGVNLLLVCRGGEGGGEVVEKFLQRADSSFIPLIEESLKKIKFLKRRYLLNKAYKSRIEVSGFD